MYGEVVQLVALSMELDGKKIQKNHWRVLRHVKYKKFQNANYLKIFVCDFFGTIFSMNKLLSGMYGT